MLVSIKKLSELTGRHRQTIAKNLTDLLAIDGEKGAKLYDSQQALPLIYASIILKQPASSRRTARQL